jgi:hypothetical protein
MQVGTWSRCRLHLSAKLSGALSVYRFYWIENAPASAFPEATRLELVDKPCCGVSEQTAIKWYKYLTF